MKKFIIKIIKFIFTTILIISIGLISINFYVTYSTKNKILAIDDLKKSDYDLILVLGAGVWNNRPSHLLEDRLLKAIELYDNNIATKILMSGDSGDQYYNEVIVMEKYALDKGVKSDDLLVDPYGFATYDSLYRTKEVFNAKKIIIVTQDYHLYRSLYIGDKLGLEVYGYSANIRSFNDQLKWDIREFLARAKDFFKVIIKPNPTP